MNKFEGRKSHVGTAITVTGLLTVGYLGLTYLTSGSDINREAAYRAAEKTQSAFSLAKTLEQAIATQTAQAGLPSPTEAPQTGYDFANDEMFCANVQTSVSQAIEDRNGGVMPQYVNEEGNQMMWVYLNRNGESIIIPLEDIMSENNPDMNTVDPGNEVCFSFNRTILQNKADSSRP